MQDQLREAIPVALAQARGDIARWKRAADVLIDNALQDIESLRGFGLGNSGLQAVEQALATSMDLRLSASQGSVPPELSQTKTSAFDVANAITATARDKPDVASRLAIEEIGHRYLTRRAG